MKSYKSFASKEFHLQLGSLCHHIEKAFYLPYCCTLGSEHGFMVKLPLILLNTWQEINTVAVVLLLIDLTASKALNIVELDL